MNKNKILSPFLFLIMAVIFLNFICADDAARFDSGLNKELVANVGGATTVTGGDSIKIVRNSIKLTPSIDEDKKEWSEKHLCTFTKGCVLEESCYPFGYRFENQFCGEYLITKTIKRTKFINQSKIGENCSNHFECETNLCINNICTDGRELISGCFLFGKYYPFGYRESGLFCLNGQFEKFKTEGKSCSNHFECKSNLCFDNICVSETKRLKEYLLSGIKEMTEQQKNETGQISLLSKLKYLFKI